MSAPIRLSHNVSVLVYHFVCPAKYRRVVVDEQVNLVIKEVCQEIELRYDMRFLEIGTDRDHVHFLVQAIPKLSPRQIIRTIQSITAKEVFAKCLQVKKMLWGGQFWSGGYYVNTVGMHGNEKTVGEYAKNQGRENEYRQLHVQQLSLL
ncbi:MAG: IS200/IS605 family transposase [Coriobacteriales bacterium]|jgi:REP element-mobilizing transposase RayT|nr:IS200/IS605 family transposase [Coriobacteriales bacterium]